MRIRKREFDFSRVGRRHRRKLIDVETSLGRKLTAGQTNFTIVFSRVILISPIRYDTLTDFTLCKMLINTGGSIHRPRAGSHEFSFRSSRTKRPVFPWNRSKPLSKLATERVRPRKLDPWLGRIYLADALGGQIFARQIWRFFMKSVHNAPPFQTVGSKTTIYSRVEKKISKTKIKIDAG